MIAVELLLVEMNFIQINLLFRQCIAKIDSFAMFFKFANSETALMRKQ